MDETFVNVLNETAVVYVGNLPAYGWQLGFTSGYEAYSPMGEIRAFATYQEANEWRLSEVRAYVNASI